MARSFEWLRVLTYLYPETILSNCPGCPRLWRTLLLEVFRMSQTSGQIQDIPWKVLVYGHAVKTEHKLVKQLIFIRVRFGICSISSTYVVIGADRIYHARDTCTAGRLVSGSRFSRKRNVWVNYIFRICFHPLDQRDAISWVEMDYRQKERSKEVSKLQYLS